MLFQKITQYAYLTRLHKPTGIYLVLWPTLWALWLSSQGQPNINTLAIFMAGAIIMRSAGCVINDYADRFVDGSVERTKDRPLITGAITPREAIALFIVLCLIAFILVLFTNPLTILLSAGALILAFCYPFVKRYSHLPQVVLGAAFAWAVPMSFAAQTNEIPGISWWLYAAVLLWTIAYDTFYGMTDREDDIKIGVKSTAILFGQYDRLITALLQVAMLTIMVVVGQYFQLSIVYYISLAMAGLLFIFQQYLIRDRIRTQCFKAFLNNQWVGMIIFLGIAVHYSLNISR